MSWKLKGLLAGIGSINFFITFLWASGLFLFPLGYSELFYLIQQNIAGGDYWTTVMIMYGISISFLVFAGILTLIDRN